MAGTLVGYAPEASSPPSEARSPLSVCMVHFSEFVLDSRVQRQAHALASRGDTVHCICIGSELEITMGKGRIVTHPIRCSKPRAGPASYLGAYARFFVAAAGAVTRVDREFRFDLVEVHNMPNFLTLTALAPKLRGVPLVLDMHDTFPELFSTTFGRSRGNPISRLMYQEERLSARLVDRVLAVTDAAKQRLNSRTVGVGRTEVVMNSPDERVFGDPRPPVAIPEEGPIHAVYHGGTSQRFGVDSLMSAVGILEDALPRLSLDVYGAFRENGPLVQLAKAIGSERIRVARRPTPFTEIPQKLARAHIGVVPTIHDEFTELLLPVKLLEYVHMGLPVVSSRLPVIEEYFSDEEVLFYEPGSEHGLAAALLQVCEEPEAAQLRAVRASRRLEELAWSRGRDAYRGLVDTLAVRSGPGKTRSRREVIPA